MGGAQRVYFRAAAESNSHQSCGLVVWSLSLGFSHGRSLSCDDHEIEREPLCLLETVISQMKQDILVLQHVCIFRWDLQLH